MASEEKEDDFEHDFEDELSCDLCGEEADDEEVNDGWVSLTKFDSFEVLICTECAASGEKMAEAIKTFLEELAADKRESMI